MLPGEINAREPLPSWAWAVHPANRALTPGGTRVYVECELPLAQHHELWLWLHNLASWEQAQARLISELENYLLI